MKVLKNNVGQSNISQTQPKQIKTQQPKVINTVKQSTPKQVEVSKAVPTSKASKPKQVETPKLKIVPRTTQQSVNPKPTSKIHRSKPQFDSSRHPVRQEPISRHVQSQEAIKPKRSQFKIINGKKKG